MQKKLPRHAFLAPVYSFQDVPLERTYFTSTLYLDLLTVVGPSIQMNKNSRSVPFMPSLQRSYHQFSISILILTKYLFGMNT